VNRQAFTWAQRILFAGASCLLGYCGVVLVNMWTFQSRERLEFEGLLSNPAPVKTASLPIVSGGLIGRIEIPRLGVSVILIEGTSSATLQRAVGHIPGTRMPGTLGNAVFSGHRDTFFRPLRKIHRHDIITVTTFKGKYNYRVLSTRIVQPAEVSVLESSDREVLTLVTCYPFYFVGPAPERFIVVAERTT
jgi:sortase A